MYNIMYCGLLPAVNNSQEDAFLKIDVSQIMNHRLEEAEFSYTFDPEHTDVECAALPGTAKRRLPCSRQRRAVMRAPLFMSASTTTVASESPLMIRFLTGKFFADGGEPGGYSDMTAPSFIIRE